MPWLFCTKDPERYEENAIESIATASAHRSAVKHNAAGDSTTWGEVPGANCTEAKGPPQRHRSLEVGVHLQTPAGEIRSRQRGWEQSPFDHLRRQPTKSRRDFAPGSSFHTPLLQILRQPTHKLQTSVLQITKTRERSLQATVASTRSTEEASLIANGDPHRHPPHRIRLRPLEHHREEGEHQDATDLAGEICSFSPGIAPTTSIKPRPKPKRTSTMYRGAGVSPLPSSTSYSGERGSGLTWRSTGDSQGRRRTRELS